jgi:predicted TIM-barrel fold metal-dependent hydrolase
VLGKLLVALGPERILWGTDSVWYGPPQPLIDAFRAFTIPEWMQERYGYPALTPAIKAAILGANATRLYGVDPPAPGVDAAALAAARAELATRLA